MFLHVKHAKSESIIRTVDTDVVMIAIYCFHNLGINRLWIEFEIGDKTRVIAIHEIVSSLPQTLWLLFLFSTHSPDAIQFLPFLGLVKKGMGLLDAQSFQIL